MLITHDVDRLTAIDLSLLTVNEVREFFTEFRLS